MTATLGRTEQAIYNREVADAMERVLTRHQRYGTWDYASSDAAIVTHLPTMGSQPVTYWWNVATLHGVALAVRHIYAMRNLTTILREEAGER